MGTNLEQIKADLKTLREKYGQMRGIKIAETIMRVVEFTEAQVNLAETMRSDREDV